MTCGEIINAASALVEEIYDNTVWMTWINACLDDLSQIARQPARVIINVQAGVYEYDVPVDVQEIIGVSYKKATGDLQPLKQLHPQDIYSEGFKLLDKIVLQNITVSTGDSLIVHCYKKFAHVTDTTQIPELEPQYHELIVLYCASRSRQKEEELEERTDYYSEYLDRRAQYAEFRRRQAAPWEPPVKQ